MYHTLLNDKNAGDAAKKSNYKGTVTPFQDDTNLRVWWPLLMTHMRLSNIAVTDEKVAADYLRTCLSPGVHSALTNMNLHDPTVFESITRMKAMMI